MINETTDEREQFDVGILQDVIDSGDMCNPSMKENGAKVEDCRHDPFKETETFSSSHFSSQQTSLNARILQRVAKENVLEKTKATENISKHAGHNDVAYFW